MSKGYCILLPRYENISWEHPLGRHFAKCGYQNFSLQIIDCVRYGEDEAIQIVEGIWQNRLATFEQHGNINVRDELSRNTRSTALDFFDL